MWLGSDFRKCKNCQSVEEKWKFFKLAKIDNNGEIKFFDKCPVCGNLVEIDPNSLYKYEKERLIEEAKYRKKFEPLFFLGLLVVFYLLLILGSYNPEALICLLLFVFAFFAFLGSP